MSMSPLVLQDVINQCKEYNLFTDDLKKVSELQNSLDRAWPVYSAIDLVYVLSGRGSALKQPVDHAAVADPEDDFHRMLKGVKIAKAVYRHRGKRVPIFYNGRSTHNEHLKLALESDVFDYPKDLFIIKPILPENTIGQARSFKEFLSKNKQYLTIAIVSSAYHLPRVSRTFGKQSPTITSEDEGPSNLEEANLLLFGIDRTFRRPGVAKDLMCEVDAMKNYSSGNNPTISKERGDNTFLNAADLLLTWSFNLQHRKPKALNERSYIRAKL